MGVCECGTRGRKETVATFVRMCRVATGVCAVSQHTHVPYRNREVRSQGHHTLAVHAQPQPTCCLCDNYIIVIMSLCVCI